MIVKVKHLVVDAGPLIKGCNLHELGEKFYMIPEVISEIRDNATRRRLQCLPYEFEHRSIPPEIIKLVTEFSKKTGDYISLSATDIKVIALTYLLEKENVGVEHLRTSPQTTTINPSKSGVHSLPPGFYVPKEGEDDSEAGWLGPGSNLDADLNEPKEEEEPLVACLTTDFAIQNVLMQMGLKVVSVNGMLIRQARTFILRCHACFATTSVMTKVFCPKCGNKTLKRVGVTINEDGTKTLHINFKKPINTKGMRVSLPKPQGGKHPNNPILVEDQPIPHNELSKMAKMKIDVLSDSYEPLVSDPFARRDLYSRSAHLGLHKGRGKGHRR